MSTELNIHHYNNEIHFKLKDSTVIGITDYSPKIFVELQKVKWYVNERTLAENKKTYIYTGSSYFGKNTRKLHQVIMYLWYEKEAFQLYMEKFRVVEPSKMVVEHHNNNAFDCRIKNLSYVSKDINLEKAHSFDKRQPELLMQASVKFYKDFHTNQYQIVTMFTAPYNLKLKNNKLIPIERLFLLYDDYYRIVYNDAKRIVEDLLDFNEFNFKFLAFKDCNYVPSPEIPEGIEVPKKGILTSTDAQGNPIIIFGVDTLHVYTEIPQDDSLYHKKQK